MRVPRLPAVHSSRRRLLQMNASSCLRGKAHPLGRRNRLRRPIRAGRGTSLHSRTERPPARDLEHAFGKWLRICSLLSKHSLLISSSPTRLASVPRPRPHHLAGINDVWDVWGGMHRRSDRLGRGIDIGGRVGCRYGPCCESCSESDLAVERFADHLEHLRILTLPAMKSAVRPFTSAVESDLLVAISAPMVSAGAFASGGVVVAGAKSRRADSWARVAELRADLAGSGYHSGPG